MVERELSTVNSVKSANYTRSYVRVLVSFWIVFPLVLWKVLLIALPVDLTPSSEAASKYLQQDSRASGMQPCITWMFVGNIFLATATNLNPTSQMMCIGLRLLVGQWEEKYDNDASPRALALALALAMF